MDRSSQHKKSSIKQFQEKPSSHNIVIQESQFKKNSAQKQAHQNQTAGSNSDSLSDSLDYRDKLEIKRREELVYMAQLAEQLEDFEEMTHYMRLIYQMDKDKDSHNLTLQEVQCLHNSFWNVIHKRRIAVRAIKKYEHKERQKDPHILETIKYYRAKIEDEIETLCAEVIDMVYHYSDIMTHEENDLDEMHIMIYYYKMKGDFNRYYQEFIKEDLVNQQNRIEEAGENYKLAWNLLQDKKDNQKDMKNQQELIPKTDVLRIGLGLNYSVFLYEIQNELRKAHQVAKETLDQALTEKEIQDLEEENLKDCIQPLHYIVQNIKMWDEEIQQENQKEKEMNENL